MGKGHSHHKKTEGSMDITIESSTWLTFLTEGIPHMKGMMEKEALEFLDKHGISMVEISISIPEIELELMFKSFKEWLEKKLMDDYPVIAKKPSTFLNWPGNVSFDGYICSPRTKKDLVQILKEATIANQKIGFQGSTHSWPNLFGELNSVSINFLLFNAFGTDQERAKYIANKDGTIDAVDVSAGCSILEKHCTFGLDKDPVLLPSCVIYTDGQYVGISSTGCHGCSFEYGSLSDQIEKITFLDAGGSEHILEKDKDLDRLRTAAIGLGSYGIITELRFKMVPDILVVTERHYWTLDQMKLHLENHPSDWISFEHYWWPFGNVSVADAFQCIVTGKLQNYDYQQDKVFCQIVRKYRDPNNEKYPYYDPTTNSYIYADKPYKGGPKSWFHNQLPYYIQEILLWIRKTILKSAKEIPIDGRFVPFMQVFVLEVLKAVQFLDNFVFPLHISTFFNAVHYLPLVSALPVRINDIELCFQASPTLKPGENENYANYFQALNKLGLMIQDEAYNGRFPVSLCVESRICAQSPCPLAATYSTSTVKKMFVYLEILSLSYSPTWENFGNCFFQMLKSIDPNVKPSLGKQWTFIDGIYEHLQTVSNKGLVELQKLQKEYDPKERFMFKDVQKLFENLKPLD